MHRRLRKSDPETMDWRWLLAAILAFAFLLCYPQPANASPVSPGFHADVASDSALTASSADRSIQDETLSSESMACWLGAIVLASLWGQGFGRKIDLGKNSPGRNFTSMFPNTRALVVDHRLPNRRHLRQRLQAFDVQVEEEANGSRAVDRALNAHFDIMFLPPDLPILNADVVRSLMQASGISTKMVLLTIASHDGSANTSADALTLTEPVEQGALERVLTRLVPHQRVDTLRPVIDQSLQAMQDALATEDFEQVTSLAQRLREVSSPIHSPELIASMDRLQGYLAADHPELTQLSQIQSTLRELSHLANGASAAVSPHRKAVATPTIQTHPATDD